jgi:4-hydroxybenzoate polyprenyltransferase
MAYLQLVRWPNLLLIALILLLAKTQLVDAISAIAGIESCLLNGHWVLLGIATTFIAASGNVVNDIFDQDIDRINKPQKLIVGNSVSEEAAWNFYYTLGGIGLASGIWLCWQLGNVSSSLVFVLIGGGLYFYSYSYKRQFLIGNLVVSLAAAMVPFMPVLLSMLCMPQLWMHLPWNSLLIAFAFFSFLTTLIRELIKDMEDIRGDQLLRCRTVPIVIGINATKTIAVGLSVFLMAAVAKLQHAWWTDGDKLILIYFSIAVQLPTLLLIGQVFRANDSKGFRLASLLSKLIMVGGVLSMIAFRFAWR